MIDIWEYFRKDWTTYTDYEIGGISSDTGSRCYDLSGQNEKENKKQVDRKASHKALSFLVKKQVVPSVLPLKTCKYILPIKRGLI